MIVSNQDADWKGHKASPEYQAPARDSVTPPYCSYPFWTIPPRLYFCSRAYLPGKVAKNTGVIVCSRDLQLASLKREDGRLLNSGRRGYPAAQIAPCRPLPHEDFGTSPGSFDGDICQTVLRCNRLRCCETAGRRDRMDPYIALCLALLQRILHGKFYVQEPFQIERLFDIDCNARCVEFHPVARRRRGTHDRHGRTAKRPACADRLQNLKSAVLRRFKSRTIRSGTGRWACFPCPRTKADASAPLAITVNTH
jgi:hypothetical protein